ncbi:MAG: hypothetical protein JO328_02785 [Hyphomicrobiales bacterium]|nr:hypothetical protein [Hyphomicrobiales bacterium]MBV8825975.1 hypothetical protein [Hyphomicrobiales bacterium]MBV9428538.1 hypothetical protein [Bradyrhizobiaceae bacterium]
MIAQALRERMPEACDSVVLLPHFTPHPKGLQTLGGRVVELSAEQRELAAACEEERSLIEIDLDLSADKQSALQRLLAAGYLVRIPPASTGACVGERDCILSPHVDDAALSLGGLIASQRGRRAAPLVVNIFSLQSYQTGLRVPADQLDAVARTEDGLAGRITGYESCSLGLRGAQDRHGLAFGAVMGWRETELRAQMHVQRDVDQVVGAVVAATRKPVGRTPIARLFAPAAIGGHVDHLIVALAAPRIAALLAIPADRIIFYEDLPYAAAGTAGGISLDGHTPRLNDITATLDEKRTALSVFRTRLRATQIDLCIGHAKRIAGRNNAAERCFVRPNGPS